MAFNVLLLGQCEGAVASGINLILHPETSAIAQKAGMLTADGRCKTLAAAADGYGRAEAAGAILLQALGTGAADAAGSLAVVRGSAVNQDGRSSSLTAPNGPSQQAVVHAALAVAGLPAGAVAALQMHGTGTALGDPIEVGAAAAVLVDGAARQAPLALMAAKSWIGHAEPAAGVVGATHSQVALSQALQLPILHLRDMNQYVAALMAKRPSGSAAAAGWFAPRQAAALVPGSSGGVPAVQGASAFAFQGTNAHVLLSNGGGGDLPLLAQLGGSTSWQRQRHWAAPAPHRQAAARVFALHSCMSESRVATSSLPCCAPARSLLEMCWPPRRGEVVLGCRLAGARLAFMWDHQVSGKPLFPGAAFFEAIAAAACLLIGGRLGQAVLAGVTIPAPLVLPPAGSNELAEAVVQVAASAADGRLQMQSLLRQGAKPTAHIAGRMAALAVEGAAAAEAPSPVQPCPALLASAPVPPSWHPAACAEVARPTHEASGLHLAPDVLDSCLQLGAVQAPAAQSQLFVPAGMGALLVASAAAPACSTAAVARPSGRVPATAATTYTDYALLDGGGSALCHIDALEAKPLRGSGQKAERALGAAAVPAEAAGGALVQQEQWLYQLDCRALGTQGGAQAATAAQAAGAGGLRLRLAEPVGTAAAAIELMQGAVAGGLQAVSLVTQGAQLAGGCQPGPDAGGAAVQAAGCWAVARTLAQELTSFAVDAIDIAQQCSGGTAPLSNLHGSAAAFLPAGAGGQPLAGVSGSPYGLAAGGGALVAATLQPTRVQAALPAHHLMPRPRGALQNLCPEAVPTAAVAPGQVLVAVKAVGINFRWVGGLVSEAGWTFSTASLRVALSCRPCCPALAETCSTCWACTLATLGPLAATAPAWWSGRALA